MSSGFFFAVDTVKRVAAPETQGGMRPVLVAAESCKARPNPARECGSNTVDCRTSESGSRKSRSGETRWVTPEVV